MRGLQTCSFSLDWENLSCKPVLCSLNILGILVHISDLFPFSENWNDWSVIVSACKMSISI